MSSSVRLEVSVFYGCELSDAATYRADQAITTFASGLFVVDGQREAWDGSQGLFTGYCSDAGSLHEEVGSGKAGRQLAIEIQRATGVTPTKVFLDISFEG